jgi:hypothetical protein
MNREQKTRAILAELGIPPESAAVTLRASKEALLKCMPATKAEAMTSAELLEKACATRAPGEVALKELFSVGRIERFRKGIPSDPYRYFLGDTPGPRRKSKNRVHHNQALQAILKGEAE